MRFPRMLFALAATAACGLPSLCAAADAPGRAANAGSADADKKDAAVDVFAVPEGTDGETLQTFMQTMAKSPPGKTPEKIREHLRKLDAALKTVFSRDSDLTTAKMAVEFRLAVLNQLSRFGDESADEDRKALIEQLLKDERPELQQRAMVFSLAQRISEIGAVGEDERRQIIKDVAAFAGQGELSQDQVQLIMLATRNLEGVEDFSLAADANNEFANVLANRNNEELQGIVEMLRGTGRRLGLPGKTMEIKGKTHDGADFDVAQYKGKVVLVDYWATWCGPCMAELPHVREMYDAYHDKGFEVVGISLDHERNDLVQFMNESKTPWVQLFPEGEEPPTDHPLATLYGVNAIPTAILLNQEGLVVSLNARGEKLTQELEKLLGPAEKPAEKPEAETPAAGQ